MVCRQFKYTSMSLIEEESIWSSVWTATTSKSIPWDVQTWRHYQRGRHSWTHGEEQ